MYIDRGPTSCSEEEAVQWRDFEKEDIRVGTEEWETFQEVYAEMQDRGMPVMTARDALVLLPATPFVKLEQKVAAVVVPDSSTKATNSLQEWLVCCELPSAVFDAFTKFEVTIKVPHACVVKCIEVFLHRDGKNDVFLNHRVKTVAGHMTITSSVNPAVSAWPVLRALSPQPQFMVVRVAYDGESLATSVPVEACFEGLFIRSAPLRYVLWEQQVSGYENAFLSTDPSPLVLNPYSYGLRAAFKRGV